MADGQSLPAGLLRRFRTGACRRTASSQRSHRLAISAIGLTCLALAVVAGFAWSYGAFYPDALGLDNGRTGAVLGVAAGILALTGQRLDARTRSALAILGILAVTVPIVHLTATGAAMLNWYLD